MIRLTDEQALAAAAPERLVNIVSAPGSGKTTVGAERFGYQRYQAGDRRGVLGLSFNRAAVAELSKRIARRWGERCIAFPHRVITFDQLHVEVLRHFVRVGLVKWPTAIQELDVRDDYRGTPGFRFLTPPRNYRRVAGLDSKGRVVSLGIKVDQPTTGIGNIDQHRALLNAGIVSHDDIRNILVDALRQDTMDQVASDWIAATYRAVVIDEVYDAALLDLNIAYTAAEAGIAVTLIGDPWQALYKWRGATPEAVQKLLEVTTADFADYQLSHSFRFFGDQMPALATALRAGDAVSLPSGVSDEVDVVLARNWIPLWSVGDNVLPLSFRTIENATDAALNLLLDVVTRGRLGIASFGKEAAIARIGLDRDRFLAEQDRVLLPLLADIRAGRSAVDVLDDLREAIKGFGVRKPGRLPNAAKEAQRVAQVEALAARLRQESVIPGLTVFQAKGREWVRVGVVLTQAQEALLAAGLQALDDENCVIYVALTRAENRCVRLGGDAALELEIEEPAGG